MRGHIVAIVTIPAGIPDVLHHTAADPRPLADSGPDGGGCPDARAPLCFLQGTLDGLARPLASTEFVVVDLETTGGSPAHGGITELAAIRTSGEPRPAAGAGQEFTTLVNPGCAIPPHVAMLTGITDALVATAPRIEEVLPQFIEFAAGAVLVAHNAPFDTGFLASACAAHHLRWPRLPILDTAALARHMLTTDEVPDCKLATLADYFGAGTRPRHRALDDARATTAVLRGLISRLAERGVATLEALRGFTQPSVPQQRRMRQLTAGLPRQPGVCLFTAAGGRVLHVVRSSDMHGRACAYFGAAETRRQIREMVEATARIVPVSCATALEAEVAEIRLTALHRPPYTCDRHRTGGAAADAPPPAVAIRALAAVPLVVAARPRFHGGWDVAWIRCGQLAGTAVVCRGANPSAHNFTAEPPQRSKDHPQRGVAAAELGKSTPAGKTGPTEDTAARHAETACLLDWLTSPGVRLISVEGRWCSPAAT